MKTGMIIIVLCFYITASQAQLNDVQLAERKVIKESAQAIYKETNGNMGPDSRMHYKTNYSQVHAAYPEAPVNAVPAWPSTGEYTAVQDPPCYKYTKPGGREVMECPGAKFQPQKRASGESDITFNNQNNENWNVEKVKTYMGYYPDVRALYPYAPANAVPAWPSSEYTQLQNPPCYEYINKRGLKVMECPGAQFEPEHVYR